MNSRAFLLLAIVTCCSMHALAQGTNPVESPDELLGQEKAITTAVPFLAIAPDARHAALGDGGVATSPDVNSGYWNVAKMAFIEDKKYGLGFSYTPWLGKIVNDMWVGYLTGFYKINREQTVSAGLKYFDLGDISFRNDLNDPLGDFNPREFAFDVGYSRMLTENFSIGGAGRFIHSNLTGAFSSVVDAKPGQSVAVDFGVYYTKPFEKSAKNSSLSLGATITNIGAKISYTGGDNKDFLPTNFRFGSAYKTELSPYNSITFILDFNKLLVPTPSSGDTATSLLSGMFRSFSDAPGGFKEEIREIMTSVGIEYWYNDIFAGRLGYFNEAKSKGNRKFMTIGLGFRKSRFGFDVAYIVPTNKREHPLAETLRFSLHFSIDQTTLEREESVTD